MPTPAELCPDLALLAPGAAVSASALRRLETHCQTLRDLGFYLHAGRDSLVVRHPARGFEATIQLTQPDDLGGRRELYRALRRTFGGWLERWLPQLVQASRAVVLPYQSLKEVIEVCQEVRGGRSR